MYINDQILNLIVKKLKGEATDEELHQLHSWTLADSLNREAYEELLNIWKESGPLLQGPSFDAGEAWVLLQQRMAAVRPAHATPEAGKPSPVRHIKRFVLAAAVAGLALTGWYMWISYRIPMQTVAALNSTQLVQLPDSSLVWLRKGSTLSYASSFHGGERATILKGEAFFDIRRNEKQPFVINTLHTNVKVLGTAFLVNSGEKTDEVIVTRGKVLVTDKERAGNEMVLEAGEQLMVADHQLERTALVDSNRISWKTGLLSFREASLLKVLEDAGDHYSVSITVPDAEQPEAGKLHITMRSQGQSLEQVLEEIRLITGWNTKKEKDKIIFYKNNAVFK